MNDAGRWGADGGPPIGLGGIVYVIVYGVYSFQCRGF